MILKGWGSLEVLSVLLEKNHVDVEVTRRFGGKLKAALAQRYNLFQISYMYKATTN